jgi:hypothetical protein
LGGGVGRVVSGGGVTRRQADAWKAAPGRRTMGFAYRLG